MKTTVLGIDKADEPTDLETVAMTIDESSVHHLMSNLTSLYADSVLAVVREYSSNGLDSHIRAGVTEPIKVTLPNDHNLNFVVEDFGIGMSKDDIANIYSRYGLSTKNGTNSEIGAFGLGCKSALAIADRFDITARKDGVETVAFIQKNNKGVGVVHFVSEEATSKPNGVKVTIPVNPVNVGRFKTAGENFFDTWALGSALIDGQPNKGIQYGIDWVEIAPAGEPIAWVKLEQRGNFRSYRSYNNLFSSTTFIIGGVAYTMERQSRSEFPFDNATYKALSEIIDSNKLIVNLPIGSVDLTPSREAIMITDKTVKSINSILADILENIRATVASHIQALPIGEAVHIYANNFALFADEVDLTASGMGYATRSSLHTRRPEFYGVKYQNEEIPTWLDVADKTYYELNSQDGRALGEVSSTNRVYTLNALIRGEYGVNNISNIIVTASGAVAGLTDSFRKNLRDYAKSVAGNTNINALLTNDTEISKWAEAVYTVVTFESYMETARKYRSAKKSEAQTGSKRSAVSYAYATLDNNDSNYGDIVKVTADQIADGGQNIIFISADNDRMVNMIDPWTQVTDALRSTKGVTVSSAGLQDYARMAFGSDKSVVFLNKGKSADAFAKKFPNAVSYKQAIANAVAGLTTAEFKNLAGVAGSVYGDVRNGQPIGFSGSFTGVADAIGKHNLLAGIKDTNVRNVFGAMVSTGKTVSIARFLADVKLDSTPKLEKLHALMIESSYATRFSLLNRLEVTRYYRHNELSESEVKQVIALLNAC